MLSATLSDRLPTANPAQSQCITPGCSHPAKAKSRCWNCYQSWRRQQRKSLPDIVLPEVGSLHEAQREARLASLRQYNASPKFQAAQHRYLQSTKGQQALQRKRQREASRRRILSFLNCASAEAIAQTFEFLPLKTVRRIKRSKNRAVTWKTLHDILSPELLRTLWNLPFSHEEFRAAKQQIKQSA
jgi:hypothetical protein